MLKLWVIKYSQFFVYLNLSMYQSSVSSPPTPNLKGNDQGNYLQFHCTARLVLSQEIHHGKERAMTTGDGCNGCNILLLS